MNRWSMVTGGKRMAVMAMILAVTVCGSGCAGTTGNNASEEGVTVGQSQTDAGTGAGGNDNQTGSTAGKGGSQAEGGAGENGNQADTGAGENGKQTGGTAGKSGSQTADDGAGKGASSNVILAFKNREMADEALVKECEEFVSLMEGYVESRFSVSAGDGQTEELEKLLSGHYEVAGRKAEDGREYYMAVRRSDAPAYEDFHEVSVSYVSYSGSTKEITQIGYDNRAGRETVLYEITDYLVMLLKDRQSEEALDLLCLIPQREADDRAFLCAFHEAGRKELEFMKNHSGLSFHQEGDSCIDFRYQDEDTLEFYSEPYTCCIRLDEGEKEHVRKLLEEGKNQDKREFASYSEAMEWVRKEHPSVRTTGAVLNLDGSSYEILGSKDCMGYALCGEESGCWLTYEESVCSYVTDRIRNAVGKDYGDFTDTWFDSGLKKASLAFPRREEREDGTWTRRVCSQTVTEEEKLEQLSKLLAGAVKGHEVLSGCPYKGVLDLERKDGQTLRMFVAADSCDSITYDGRIGFEYGKQEALADIFDEAMK